MNVHVGHTVYAADPADPEITDSGAIAGGLVVDIEDRCDQYTGEMVETYTCVRLWRGQLQVSVLPAHMVTQHVTTVADRDATALYLILAREVGKANRYNPAHALYLRRALTLCELAGSPVPRRETA